MLAARLFERAEHEGSAAAILQMGWQVLPRYSAHSTLVGAGNRQAWALVLVALGPEAEAEWSVPRLPGTPSHSLQVSKGLTWIVS